MNKDRMLKMLKKLSLAFGPSGCEDAVADIICEYAENLYDECIRDCFGNVILKVASKSEKPPIMLSAHMDEVGFMISDIDEYGYLHFQNVGGISKAVIPGRRVKVEGKNGLMLDGVISSKAIHLQTADERKKPFSQSSLVIDIGAVNRFDSMQYTDIGCFATFESDFYTFGESSDFGYSDSTAEITASVGNELAEKSGKWIKSKALDDRLGCAIMLETMYSLKESGIKPSRDIYFAFTTREEMGLSGATVAANRIRPEFAIVLETTAVSDVYGTPDNLTVAKLGEGGCVLIADRGTIYDRDLFRLALDTAKQNGIKCQIKKYVSGGNDAAHIHKSSDGVKTLAISAPTRYLHSSSCVINTDDFYSIYSLLNSIIPML